MKPNFVSVAVKTGINLSCGLLLCANAIADNNSPTLAEQQNIAGVKQLDLLEQKLLEQQQQLMLLQQEIAALKQNRAANQQAQVEKPTAEIEKPSEHTAKNKTSSSEQYIASNTTESKAPKANKAWQIKSYGSMAYKSAEIFRNTQDTEPDRRASTDLERVVLEFVYDFNPNWQVEVELEYEHGGTGSALEYDGFEEFGEFESEIEAGGEVIVEKLQFRYQHNDNFAVKFGRIFVPVGLGTDLHKPEQYLTAQRHWSEASMIPQAWSETGVNFIGKWQGFTGQALITTGLNSEYFRTYKWVATGHQQRFETVNSDDLAMTLRVDYGDVKSGNAVGFSYYNSNTSGNRNNLNNIEGDGNLSIYGIHGTLNYENWRGSAQYLYGTLDDSSAITLANKTTPGLKPGNFAQLGSESESAFVELGYNTQALFSLSSPLYFFGSYDYANPIKAVESGLAPTRFDQQEFSLGVNYFPIPSIVLKAQMAEQYYAQDNLDKTRSFALSVGYNFSM